MSAPDDHVIGRAYDARLMRRLLGYLAPYRSAVVLAAVAIVGHACLQLVPPLLTKRVVDEEIPSGNLSGLGLVAALYLGTLVGSSTLEYVQTWTMQMTGQRIMFDLRMAVFAHLHRLDIAYFDRNPVGRLMTRVTTDVDALNELFTAGVVSIVGDVITLLGIMGVLLWLDWRLALVTFAVLPLLWWLTQWFRVHVRESYRTVRTWIARINAFLQERITGMATVQLFGQEARDFESFDAIDRAHRDANVDSIFYYAVFYPAVELISALAVALILWVGGAGVEGGTLTLGALVAFVQYAQRFFRPISDMSEKFNVLQGAMASSERIFALLDTPPGEGEGPSVVAAAPGPAGGGRIRFEDVTFSYVEGQPVLRHVSFEIEPGQRVAIVGATGSGKTTVANLLVGFYRAQSGRITIDGRDVRAMDRPTLRSMFALVPQEVHLFTGSIADNVRLGSSAMSDAQVRQALDAVHASTFVDRMPLGMQTMVTERGGSLSAGQKQLLSFARALASGAPVLVLDEATSSVDTTTEVMIREALAATGRGRTTIAIAHRLSTIQDMDRILVLHKGELRESGTHQELLALRGIYHRLHALQYGVGEAGSGGGGG